MLLFSLDEVDRRQLSEQEKCLETCITKSGACILNSLFAHPCPKNRFRQLNFQNLKADVELFSVKISFDNLTFRNSRNNCVLFITKEKKTKKEKLKRN